MNKLERYSCPHEPKFAKKIGTLGGCSAEIFVCKNCKEDPLLSDFSEVLMD